jgi:hypothetical protein
VYPFGAGGFASVDGVAVCGLAAGNGSASGGGPGIGGGRPIVSPIALGADCATAADDARTSETARAREIFCIENSSLFQSNIVPVEPLALMRTTNTAAQKTRSYLEVRIFHLSD